MSERIKTYNDNSPDSNVLSDDAQKNNVLKSNILSDRELTEINREIEHAPYKSAVAIEALKIVQRHRGWVSDDSLAAVATYLEMSVAALEGIATFYNLIFREPVGDNVILVCNSVSCWIKGCDKLAAQISAKLEIGFGETTPDNRYTLLPITCLGACDCAPVMLIGEELYRNLDEPTIEKLFTREVDRD